MPHIQKNKKITIDPFDLIKGKKLIGSWGGSCKMDKDINKFYLLHKQKKINLSMLKTKMYKIDDINKAISDYKKGKLSEQYLKIKMKKNILVWQFFEINQSKLIRYIERNKNIRCYKNSFGKLKKNDLGSYLINVDYLLKNYSIVPNKYKKIHENIHTKLFEKYSKHIYCFNLIGISKKNFNPYEFSKILSCQINCIISFFKEKNKLSNFFSLFMYWT